VILQELSDSLSDVPEDIVKKSKENISIQVQTQADYPRNGEGSAIG
jgi:hypothetical protein